MKDCDLPAIVAKMERTFLIRALNGRSNIKAAARSLNLSRRQVEYKIQLYGITRGPAQPISVTVERRQYV